MPKIDMTTCPAGEGSRYPSPYDEPCRGKQWQALGQSAELTQFGVNRIVLKPGAWSSQRHWHEHEDEFVWVLNGEAVLVTDAGKELLHAGDCAGFAAGERNGHHFVNESETDTVLLVVGTRDDRDFGEYPDIDMRFCAGRYSDGGGFETKGGKPLA